MFARMYAKVTNILTCVGSAALFISPSKLQAKELIACHDCHMKRLPKAKELPIYDKRDTFTTEYDEKSTLPLVPEISLVRKQLIQYASYLNAFQEQAVHIYNTGVAHSKSTLEYLKNEENKVQRIMIIASGGLFGFLYARKGGIAKKMFYTTLGTGVVFSAFYPAISKEYISVGWKEAKHQVNNILVDYGGYDTDKWAEETNARLDYVKSAMKLESLTNKMNEMFQKSKDFATQGTKGESNKDVAVKDQDVGLPRT